MPDKKGYDFSATRQIIDQMVQTGAAPGASLQVIRKGETLLAFQIGYADLENQIPLTTDSIFRIYSMTKPITAVLLMTLFEKGLVHLQDPVREFLPGFSQPMVWTRDNEDWVTRPATRDITLHHLLTMTSGIPYPDTDHPASRAIAGLMKTLFSGPVPDQSVELISVANQLGQIPLCFDPGDGWQYGLSIDVIGAVIEVVTGKKLGQYMREVLLDPLSMKDTDFYVPAEKASRLVDLYAYQEKRLVPFSEKMLTPGNSNPLQPAHIEYGGAGLFSTRSDYDRFARMLLAGGTLDGIRIISPKTVNLIRSNHLTAEQRHAFNTNGWHGYSYGLGVRTLKNPAMAGSLAKSGEFGWEGAAGTWFRIDPVEDMIIVYLTQHMPGEHSVRIPPIQATIYAAL